MRITIEPGDAVMWRAAGGFFRDTRRGIAREISGRRAKVQFANGACWLPLESLERLPTLDEAFGDKPFECHGDDWYWGPVDEGDLDDLPGRRVRWAAISEPEVWSG